MKKPGDNDRWLADMVSKFVISDGVKYDKEKRAKQLRESGRQKDVRFNNRQTDSMKKEYILTEECDWRTLIKKGNTVT